MCRYVHYVFIEEANTSLGQKKPEEKAEAPWNSLQNGYGTFRENTAKFTQGKCAAWPELPPMVLLFGLTVGG